MQVSTYVGALALAGAAVLGPATAASASVTTHNATDVGLFGIVKQVIKPSGSYDLSIII